MLQRSALLGYIILVAMGIDPGHMPTWSLLVEGKNIVQEEDGEGE